MTTVDAPPVDVVMPDAVRGRRRLSVAAIISIAWLVLVLLAAVLAPVMFPGGPNIQDINIAFQGPSAAHPLGTDALGRDLLVRLVYGAQSTFGSVLVAVVIKVTMGVLTGLAAGYLGGRIDQFFTLCADISQAIPLLLVLLIVATIAPGNVILVMAVFGFFSSASLFRVMRGTTFTVVGELYITAARVGGLSEWAIILRHLVPRLSGYVRVQASIAAALALTMNVSLGFVGLDVVPPTPSWGGVTADATAYLVSATWMLFPPVVLICATILAFGVLGDSDQLVSRRRRRRREQEAQAAAGAVSEAPKDAGPVIPQLPGALVEVRDLTVTAPGADSVVLVQHVTFHIGRGEVVGMVGESGAGKSVTSGALMRLDDTEVEGTVFFDGARISGIDEKHLREVRGGRIAYIGQDPMLALDPLCRVGALIREALHRHRGLRGAAAREEMLRLLAAVRITDPATVARRYPHEISGGMAQRVAIALALAGEPELLIADEPTTALDVTVQMEVLGLLRTLQQERGMSVLLVTHDWGVVADMCDRVIVMYRGELVEEAPVAEIFAEPRHPYTRALLASNPHVAQRGTTLPVITGGFLKPSEGYPAEIRSVPADGREHEEVTR